MSSSVNCNLLFYADDSALFTSGKNSKVTKDPLYCHIAMLFWLLLLLMVFFPVYQAKKNKLQVMQNKMALHSEALA